MHQFYCNIENLWGLNEVLIAGPKDYFIYTDQYKTRSHINFDAGMITIETIASNNPIEYLRRAIINTLLMDAKFEHISFYSDELDKEENLSTDKVPFLYEQVIDNYGNPIRWNWHAAQFADYLLQNRLKIRMTNASELRQIRSITIRLVPYHMDRRARKYLDIVQKASHQYKVDQSLILAIMQTESSFNPYAVSATEALGLMQIVRHSAGQDVFKMKGRNGQPSRSYLFDPKNNIDVGTAYLAMLQNNYFGDIRHPISRRYAVITAYNGGVGSVLRVFSHDYKEALKIINSLQPDEVYQILSTQHPSKESRRYLYKVNKLQKHIGLTFSSD